MQYLGGKERASKNITDVLKKYRKSGQIFVDAFVGGASISAKMGGKIICNDLHPELILMYKDLQRGRNFPDDISYEQYYDIKASTNDGGLKAFVGFGCSFSGKYFGGYARDYRKNDENGVMKEGGSFASVAKRGLAKKMKNLMTAIFINGSFLDITCYDCLIYCDPPYIATTKYNGVDRICHDDFYDHVRELSKNNTVIVSGFEAPDDFECIAEFKSSDNMKSGDNKQKQRIEKLFIYTGVK